MSTVNQSDGRADCHPERITAPVVPPVAGLIARASRFVNMYQGALDNFPDESGFRWSRNMQIEAVNLVRDLASLLRAGAASK